MGILKSILSIGAGIIAAAASYVLMSNKKDPESQSRNDSVNNNPVTEPDKEAKSSEKMLRTLDKLQIGLVNFARFSSDVIRSISLFIRAMRCYEYDSSYQYSSN